jgi:LPXTG-motif cell wall-anchored protein
MLRIRSSTLVFALAYIVLVVGVFLALGGAAYASDEDPSSASDQYGSKVEEIAVTGPSGPTDTAAPSGPTDTAAPSRPTDTAAPSGPTDTAAPSRPTDAAAPSGRTDTAAPSGPADTGAEVADVAQALPNTGLSLLATALVGGALIAIGVALRRRERRGKV